MQRDKLEHLEQIKWFVNRLLERLWPEESPGFSLLNVLTERSFTKSLDRPPTFWVLEELISGIAGGYALPLDLTEIPASLLARWALEAVLFYFGREGKIVNGSGLAAMLSELLTRWQVASEATEKAIQAAKKLSRKDLELLATFSKPLFEDVGFKSESRPWDARQTVPVSAPKEPYFNIWTEKGQWFGTELEYKEKYSKAPSSWGPRIWIDLISGSHSVRIDRKRLPVKLSGDKLKLLCKYLRNFNKRILTENLNKEMPYHLQILDQLHTATFDVLDPFIDVRWGESRRLMPYAKDNRRMKLTFCLIDHYKKA